MTDGQGCCCEIDGRACNSGILVQVLQYFWDAVWCWMRCSSGSAVRGAGVITIVGTRFAIWGLCWCNLFVPSFFLYFFLSFFLSLISLFLSFLYLFFRMVERYRGSNFYQRKESDLRDLQFGVLVWVLFGVLFEVL